MPIAPRAPPKAMRGKCERGHSFLTPGLQFHGVDRADVFNNIRVRASRCGECALNPPTSQPIPRRRPSLAPHSETPSPSTSDRPRSADARPPTSQHLPRRRPSPAPAQRHARPLRSTSGTKKRHRTMHVRCRMFRSTVVRSVIWVVEPRAVRRRCGALACRRGA